METNQAKTKEMKTEIKKIGIANWLTIIRMVLMIPFIILMTIAFYFISKHSGTFWYDGIKLVGDQKYPILLSIIYWINVIIFIFAMITDFADGHIARKTKTISQFGKIFDPIADKITTTLMLLFLVLMNYSFLPIVVLFIVRDILVDGARVYAVKKDIKVAANWWGKIKTIIVSLALLVVAFAAPWMIQKVNGKPTTDYLKLFFINIPLLLGLLLSWISGIIYLSKYLKGIRNESHLNKETKESSDTQNKDNKEKNTADKNNDTSSLKDEDNNKKQQEEEEEEEENKETDAKKASE
ncbi:CDP-diacylglycerol-glycerol-3-phosphate-3-phosphatidyltransferase [Metamycoplasma auris 15026]|uniref:CDP-diacylglycerol--glycerol-3-phosphate 3-phosphatidyltransferase n=1 Tax=Metamycoplasma auris 15026 TaxID=1188233 RepID=N9TRF5_9BACT|nr:CDP-diacylglycerol--glycerol-3-phosphate 3-phosphatidyltransferase [Metamycoplasma auris]ENY68660.1 CDP-diacylglycerol-glycerol-3-phosphate-3-phosphatidyltransferase [Metamycoplasma auris 15026]